MSLYRSGVSGAALQKQAAVTKGPPAWIGPLGIATLAGIITVLFTRVIDSRPRRALNVRAESMWVRK